jgi:signal recognition particle subunit SRP54
MMRNPN